MTYTRAWVPSIFRSFSLPFSAASVELSSDFTAYLAPIAGMIVGGVNAALIAATTCKKFPHVRLCYIPSPFLPKVLLFNIYVNFSRILLLTFYPPQQQSIPILKKG